MEREYREPGAPVDGPVREEPVAVRDRIRWGPIIAGLLSTISVLLILGLLGTAIGMTIFDEGTDGRTVGTGAAIWGIATALLAFLVGGWVAAWAAEMTDSTGAVANGAMVAVAAIAVLLWLVGTGLGYLFGAVTANLELIAQVGRDLAVGDVDAAAAQAAFEEARTGTWATLIGLVVALGAAALGGWLGQSRVVVEPAPARRRRAQT
jgi:hypothetical protein